MGKMLPGRPSREMVNGFGKSQAGKAVWKNRKEVEKYSEIHYNKNGTIIVNHGEYAHDYVYDSKGSLIGRPMRELTDQERKDNADFL